MENQLLPYDFVTTIPASSVLVFAPHADDEVFGCAGTLAAMARCGVAIHGVILTDGAVGGDATTRRKESEAAAALLGYGAPEFWNYSDRGLRYSEDLVVRILAMIMETQCDLVFAPSPSEIHPDHRQASWSVLEAMRRLDTSARLAFYEVGIPLRPNILVDITENVKPKEQAMRCFGSQIANQKYVEQIQALNFYRTYTLPKTVEAAEAFWLLDKSQLEDPLITAVVRPISPGVRIVGTDVPAQLPLVSILVRSLDRDYLAEALDSVAVQTYPHIEVIVIAVRPEHRPLPKAYGGVAIRLIQTDQALLRSKAANSCLDHARGEYCLFLDDDDWIMPDHVSRLVKVMRAHPKANAAYTGVSMVTQDGVPTGQAFDLPFDGIRQLAGNMTPIHAVLFRTSVRKQGCRFDESLDRYEDWDFWLQLSRLAPMVHLPGISAAYRIHQSSGVHDDAGTDSASTATIHQKWIADWSSQQLGAIMHRVWTHPELETHIQNLNSSLTDSRISLEIARRTADTAVENAARDTALAQQRTQELLERVRVSEQLSDAAQTHWQSALQEAQTERDQRRSLEQRLVEHAALLSQQTAHIQHLKDSIFHLHNSASWRITAPWRWISSRLRLRQWF